MAINLVNDNISTIEIQNKKYNIKSVPFHGTEAEWENNNYIPKDGEIIIYDIDENYDYKRIKIGDGTTVVNDLPFSNDMEGVAYLDDEDNENVEVIPDAPIDVIAEVGQTIVVKEVDINGKPTKWEAADYQPRTHYDKIDYIFPETTVTEGSDFAMVDFLLIEGKQYIVNFNGIDYSCIAKTAQYENETFIYIGNTIMFDGETDTGEPFAAVTLHTNGINVFEFTSIDDEMLEFIISVKGEVSVPIPQRYLENALPYYIKVEQVTTSDSSDKEEYICYDTVQNVKEIFESGREVKVLFKTTGDNPMPWVNYLNLFLQGEIEGLMFMGFSCSSFISSGGNMLIYLIENEDGTFTIRNSLTID